MPKHEELGLTPQQLLEIYYYLKMTREFDLAIVRLYRQGKMLGGAYTGTGNEATAVGSAFALRKDDYLFPMHRDLGAHLVKGQTVNQLWLNHMGKQGSLARGRDGTGHYADLEKRIFGNISHLGAMIPVAVGAALQVKLQKQNRVSLTYIGDGGTRVGEFHEGVNFAAVLKLPFILIIENNQFAYSTPTSKQYTAQRLIDCAESYGIPGVQVDGTDFFEVYHATCQAVERARQGKGPTLIESVTMRMRGHAEHDNMEYVPKEMLDEWEKKDPIVKFEKYMHDHKLFIGKVREGTSLRIKTELETAIEFAEQAPYPTPEEAVEGVYAD